MGKGKGKGKRGSKKGVHSWKSYLAGRMKWLKYKGCGKRGKSDAYWEP